MRRPRPARPRTRSRQPPSPPAVADDGLATGDQHSDEAGEPAGEPDSERTGRPASAGSQRSALARLSAGALSASDASHRRRACRSSARNRRLAGRRCARGSGPDVVPAYVAGRARRSRPRALLLTHIHLDHAGASGSLVQMWPDLEVYVHERGARHLAAPERLMDSARRLYGDDMDRLWGEMVPVRGEQPQGAGGWRVDPGGSFKVAYTPGTPHTTSPTSTTEPHSSATPTACGSPTAGPLPPTPPPTWTSRHGNGPSS